MGQLIMVENTAPITKKVVLIGDSQVGKTCIFNRVIYEKYHDENLATFSTCHRAKEYSINHRGEAGVKMKINLWDTAGQERYRALTKNYINSSDAIILVYDTTYADSLSGIKEWFDDIQEKVDPAE